MGRSNRVRNWATVVVADSCPPAIDENISSPVESHTHMSVSIQHARTPLSPSGRRCCWGHAETDSREDHLFERALPLTTLGCMGVNVLQDLVKPRELLLHRPSGVEPTAGRIIGSCLVNMVGQKSCCDGWRATPTYWSITSLFGGLTWLLGGSSRLLHGDRGCGMVATLGR